jgi:hypothetical protein
MGSAKWRAPVRWGLITPRMTENTNLIYFIDINRYFKKKINILSAK